MENEKWAKTHLDSYFKTATTTKHRKNYGNLTLLFSKFPQYEDLYLHGSNPCKVAVQHMLLNFLQENVTTLNFDSLHFYSDIGYPFTCNNKANGSYMEVVLRLEPMPLGIPISLCLPAECNSSDYFQPLLDSAVHGVNKFLDNAKKTMDFDNLNSVVPQALFKSSGDQDK